MAIQTWDSSKCAFKINLSQCELLGPADLPQVGPSSSDRHFLILSTIPLYKECTPLLFSAMSAA